MYTLISNTARPHKAINHFLIVSNCVIDVLLGILDSSISSPNTVIDLFILYIFLLKLLIVP